MPKTLVAMLAVMFLIVSGCQDGGGSHITGTVYLNDEIVELGSITFTPELGEDSAGPTIIANVEKGELKFMDKAPSTPGKNSVTLVAPSKLVKEQPADNAGPGGEFITIKKQFELPEPGNAIDLKFEWPKTTE